MLYTQFLNYLGLYSYICNLENSIDYYKKACSKNQKDEIAYKNLKERLEKYKGEYQRLNEPLSKLKLKNIILNEWNLIAKQILNDSKLFQKVDSMCKLPIYALVLYLVKYEMEFKEMYEFLINHDLYDSNSCIGNSSEPFFSLLPQKNFHIFCTLNEKVIKDRRTDFHILQNGSDYFEYRLFDRKQNPQDKEYWNNHLLWCLQSNLSVLDSRRYKSIEKISCWEYTPNIYEIFKKENHLELLIAYLLTEEGIQKQYENSIYPSVERNRAIDFYIKKLSEIGKESILLKKLKNQ